MLGPVHQGEEDAELRRRQGIVGHGISRMKYRRTILRCSILLAGPEEVKVSEHATRRVPRTSSRRRRLCGPSPRGTLAFATCSFAIRRSVTCAVSARSFSPAWPSAWSPPSPPPLRTPAWTLPGLQAPVEIRVDRWGIAHIYARERARPLLRAGIERGPRPALPVRDLAAAGHRHRGGDPRTARAAARHRHPPLQVPAGPGPGARPLPPARRGDRQRLRGRHQRLHRPGERATRTAFRWSSSSWASGRSRGRRTW